MTVRKSMSKNDVFSRIILNPKTGCWHWTGSMARSRKSIYPILGSTSARKMSFEAFIGSWPSSEDGPLFGISCNSHDCVNPWHVEVGATRSLYLMGAEAKKSATHCIHGHEFSIYGQYINKADGKVCRECVRIRGRIYWEKSKIK